MICILTSGGCGDKVKKEMGFGKKSPDEYQVITNKPLSLPPNYDLIPPSEEAQNEVAINEDKDVEEKNSRFLTFSQKISDWYVSRIEILKS